MALSGEDRVTGLVPVADMSMRINGGYFILRQGIFDYLDEGCDLVMDGLVRASADGRVCATPYDGFWAPMDTLKERTALEEQYRSGVALAHRIGDRAQEWFLLCNLSYPLYMAGRWDEALATTAGIPDDVVADTGLVSMLSSVLPIRLHRGEHDQAEPLLERFSGLEHSADVQDRSAWLAARAESMGGWALSIVVGGLAGYLGYKFISRQRFLRELRIARIGVDELKARIDSGEGLVIVDLRHALDVAADPETIPGAFRLIEAGLGHNVDHHAAFVAVLRRRHPGDHLHRLHGLG